MFSFALEPDVFVSVEENDCWTSTSDVSKVLVRVEGCVILNHWGLGFCYGTTIYIFYQCLVFDCRLTPEF